MKYFIVLLILLNSNSIVIAQEMKLTKEVLKIEEYISRIDESNENISNAPAKWHLLHSLQVITGVIEEATNPNPDNFN